MYKKDEEDKQENTDIKYSENDSWEIVVETFK